MTVEEITSDKQLVEPQGLPPIPEESLIFCKDCRQNRDVVHFHQDDKVFKTCNMCRARRRQRLANRKANDKLAPTEKPGARSEYFKDYNKNRRKPSPPKATKPPKPPTEHRRAKQREYNRRYRTKKKAEKEALAKL